MVFVLDLNNTNYHQVYQSKIVGICLYVCHSADVTHMRMHIYFKYFKSPPSTSQVNSLAQWNSLLHVWLDCQCCKTLATHQTCNDGCISVRNTIKHPLPLHKPKLRNYIIIYGGGLIDTHILHSMDVCQRMVLCFIVCCHGDVLYCFRD